jgi:hypothetical protein
VSASINKIVSSFPVESEYARCVTALDRAGILTRLPGSGSAGIIGTDGREYPVPNREEVAALFDRNRELVERKVPQGFERLALTPIAMPVPLLIDRMRAAVLRHAGEGTIFRTRRSPSNAFVPIRVNPEKTVWVWETLRQAFDTDRLVYFPQEHPGHQKGQPEYRGQTKSEAISNETICAVPGWSVGLVESISVMPMPGEGATRAGRKQLEIGLSPREYLRTLHEPAYAGETGKTLEDFITEFLTRLETTNEVSNDISDNNALWCLGQYMKIPYAEVVPTGRWHRPIGRVRLDMHRTGNKRCTKSAGAATVVRLRRL